MIGEARADLSAAFAVQQKLDDEVPETDEQRRAMLTEIVRRCRRANEALDAQAAEFDRLRDLQATAPQVLASLPGRLEQARMEVAQARDLAATGPLAPSPPRTSTPARPSPQPIAEAQEAVAQTIGNLRMLEQDAAEARTAGAEWGSKALAASQRADQMRAEGNTAEADRFDSLAKVALGKQLGFEKQVDGLEPTIAQQNEVVDKLKAGLAGMQDKLTELRDKRNELVSRAKIAEAQSRVHDSLRSIDVMDPTSELSRFEQKVRREEAKVLGANELAASSLDAQFESLESTADELEVQARLDALKAGLTTAVEAAPQRSLEGVVDAEVVHDPDSPSGSSAS